MIGFWCQYASVHAHRNISCKQIQPCAKVFNHDIAILITIGRSEVSDFVHRWMISAWTQILPIAVINERVMRKLTWPYVNFARSCPERNDCISVPRCISVPGVVFDSEKALDAFQASSMRNAAGFWFGNLAQCCSSSPLCTNPQGRNVKNPIAGLAVQLARPFHFSKYWFLDSGLRKWVSSQSKSARAYWGGTLLHVNGLGLSIFQPILLPLEAWISVQYICISPSNLLISAISRGKSIAEENAIYGQHMPRIQSNRIEGLEHIFLLVLLEESVFCLWALDTFSTSWDDLQSIGECPGAQKSWRSRPQLPFSRFLRTVCGHRQKSSVFGSFIDVELRHIRTVSMRLLQTLVPRQTSPMIPVNTARSSHHISPGLSAQFRQFNIPRDFCGGV